MQYCQGVVNWDEGRQQSETMFGLHTLQELLNGHVASPTPTFSYADNPFNMDPNSLITGGGTGSDQVYAPGTQPQQLKVYLKHIECNVSYVSLVTSPIELEVLWCEPKRNVVRKPHEEWTYQLQQEQLGQPAANQGAPTAGYPEKYFPGQHPTSLMGWRKLWKIVHLDKFVLQPGSSVKINANIHVNKMIDLASLNSLNDGSDNKIIGLPGISLFPMYIVKSAAIENTTQGVMTYGAGKFGWLAEERFTFFPCKFDKKVPVQRIYPSLFNESFTPATPKEKRIDDVDQVIGTLFVS
jgi:hypothetical protein